MNELGTALRRKGWVFRDGQWWKQGVRVGNSRKATELEYAPVHAALAAAQAKKEASPRFFVSVKSFRRRLLDQDNLCEKFCVDLLRYSGVIPSDAPGIAKIEVSQEKVSNKEREYIRIQVYEIRTPAQK